MNLFTMARWGLIVAGSLGHRFPLLGQIPSEEDAAGRGMLTVIVVHKVGDMQPGPGFFELAKSLGRDTRDPLKCWVDELHHVHAVWSKHDS